MGIICNKLRVDQQIADYAALINGLCTFDVKFVRLFMNEHIKACEGSVEIETDIGESDDDSPHFKVRKFRRTKKGEEISISHEDGYSDLEDEDKIALAGHKASVEEGCQICYIDFRYEDTTASPKFLKCPNAITT